ncbi:RagB/SusD family nutrient uptake outer membrane protein, partial [Nonlabens ulvanivorans]
MKKIINLFLILSVAVVVNSCTDDYVDVASRDANSEDFFNTPEDYQSALIGAYDLLQSTYMNVMLGEIASNNTVAGGESATDVIGIQQIDDMTHTPVNDQLKDIWGWMYSGVNRANYIMEFQDKIDFPEKQQVLAETRFLRAYYYF